MLHLTRLVEEVSCYTDKNCVWFLIQMLRKICFETLCIDHLGEVKFSGYGYTRPFLSITYIKNSVVQLYQYDTGLKSS